MDTGRTISTPNYEFMASKPTRYFSGTSYGPHYSSSKSKLMWMYWLSLNPSSELDTYYEAVKHGSRVTHRVPLQDAMAILPHRQLQGSPPRHLPLSRMIQHPKYVFDEVDITDVANLNSVYINEVEVLLRQENARAFLEHGGLIWRLALEFGGSRLWNDLFLGPSVFCVDARLGERIPDYNWIADVPSQVELDILLGVIYKPGGTLYSRSLFPPYSVFHGSPHWMGAWTADNEEWFLNLIKQLRAGKLKPQPKSHWRTSTGRSNKKTITEELAQSLVQAFDSGS
jgi:hypothetical protein